MVVKSVEPHVLFGRTAERVLKSLKNGLIMKRDIEFPYNRLPARVLEYLGRAFVLGDDVYNELDTHLYRVQMPWIAVFLSSRFKINIYQGRDALKRLGWLFDDLELKRPKESSMVEVLTDLVRCIDGIKPRPQLMDKFVDFGLWSPVTNDVDHRVLMKLGLNPIY